MSMTVYVVDVESGEVVASVSLEESVSAGEVDVAVRYRGVALGGSVFARTPLGRATARVMDRAVVRITARIASRKWRPKIAAVNDDYSVLLNGGYNRRVRVGAEYDVLGAASAVTDPETGDVLGRRPGSGLGRVRVREVHDRYCVAVFVEGDGAAFAPGLVCRLFSLPKGPPPAPVRAIAPDDTSSADHRKPRRRKPRRRH